MYANVVPLNERGAAYLRDLQEQDERNRRQRELNEFVRLTSERSAPTYNLAEWLKGWKD